jgi:hypothetical protein
MGEQIESLLWSNLILGGIKGQNKSPKKLPAASGAMPSIGQEHCSNWRALERSFRLIQTTAKRWLVLSTTLMSNRRDWNKLHSQSSGLFGDPSVVVVVGICFHRIRLLGLPTHGQTSASGR